MPHRLSLLLLRTALIGCWSFVVVTVLSGLLTDSPLQLRPTFRRNLYSVTPEGWKFFTRSAREPVERSFRLVNGNWELETIANTSATNWFGLRKDARIRSMDLVHILGRVPADAWLPCDGDIRVCDRTRTSPPTAVSHETTIGSACGDLLVERRPMVPWAWSRSGEVTLMPAEYVRLSVTCIDPRQKADRKNS